MTHRSSPQQSTENTGFSPRMLAIIDMGPLAGLRLNEAIAALMVLATYGHAVQILLCGDAVQLIETPQTPAHHSPFKSVSAMIESFEFYDLLPVWICEAPAPQRPLVDYTVINLQDINLQQFTTTLRWS
jgi:sulfur relay (sulfurtransferase) DsrF/TusC family protein